MTTTIILDDIRTERMYEQLFVRIHRALDNGTAKEMPLVDTGFKAIWQGSPLRDEHNVMIFDGEIYFQAGSILNRGGLQLKRYKLNDNI